MSQRITRVGAYAACVRGSRLLLVHQLAPGPASGRWTLPGGGVDFGERPAAAVVREVREETGGDAVVCDLLGVHDNVYRLTDGVLRHGIRLLYAAEISGDLAVGGGDEIDDLAWHPIGRLPSNVTAWASLAATLVTDRRGVC